MISLTKSGNIRVLLEVLDKTRDLHSSDYKPMTGVVAIHEAAKDKLLELINSIDAKDDRDRS